MVLVLKQFYRIVKLLKQKRNCAKSSENKIKKVNFLDFSINIYNIYNITFQIKCNIEKMQDCA